MPCGAARFCPRFPRPTHQVRWWPQDPDRGQPSRPRTHRSAHPADPLLPQGPGWSLSVPQLSPGRSSQALPRIAPRFAAGPPSRCSFITAATEGPGLARLLLLTSPPPRRRSTHSSDGHARSRRRSCPRDGLAGGRRPPALSPGSFQQQPSSKRDRSMAPSPSSAAPRSEGNRAISGHA